MALDLVKTLSDLVALPSVNPMGELATGPEFFEYRVTEYLEDLFQRLQLPHERQTIAPKRDNIIARLDGRGSAASGPVLLLEAHQDTVPVEGMTIAPWKPTLRDGRLYGRGACDIKGGLTAMLGAVARLAAEPVDQRPTVIMACTVNEEYGFTGAKGVCELWSNRRGSIFPRKPDMAIVAEPTNLQIVVAHKGVVRWRCRAKGRAAHSSLPHLGENAIYRMASVVLALERYQREVAPQLGEHPLCGRPSLSVGTIHGGLSVNTVPDACTIEIDRRLLPHDDPRTAYRHAIEHVAANVAGIAGSIEHLPPFIESPGLSQETNGALADALATVVGEVAGPAAKIGVPFGTDAAMFAQHFPTVVFGPGSIDQAHTADEWVPLIEVEQASEILYRFARSLV